MPPLFFMNQLPTGFAVALGLCFILPLLNYFRDPPIGDFFGEWSSALVMAIGAVSIVRSMPKIQAVNGALFALPVLLILLMAIQAIFGRYAYPTDAFFYLCYLGMFMLVVLLGQHFRSENMASEVARRMAWAVILVALVNLLAQLVQLGRWDEQLQPWVVKLRGESVCALYGNTGQSNQTSAIAWLAAFGTVYLAHERRMVRWLLPVLVALFMFSSALTVSRMAWLFLFLSVLGLLILRFRWTSSLARRLSLAGGVIALFALITFGASALLNALDPSCMGSLARLTDGQQGSVLARIDYLGQAILVWMKFPWIGAGAASFNGMAYQVITSERQQPIDAYAHNIVAQLLAEFGAIGVLALVFVVVACLLAVWRNRQHVGAEDVLLLGWLGVMGIHSLLEYPLWYVHFLMLVGLALGLLIRPEWRVLSVHVPARSMVGVLAAAAIAVSLVLFNDYRSLDRLMFLVLQKVENRIGSSPQVDALLVDASGSVLFFRPHADHMLGIAMAMTGDRLEEKIASTDKLLSRVPTPETIARRVVLAVLDKDVDTARWHLRRLRMFFPRQSQSLMSELRSMAERRREDLGALLGLLDEMATASGPDSRPPSG